MLRKQQVCVNIGMTYHTGSMPVVGTNRKDYFA